MKNSKRFGAGLLATTMMVGMLPAVASAEEVSLTTEYSAVGVLAASGYENGTGTLDINLISGFDTGLANEDGGLVEIVTYNTAAQVAYAVAGAIGQLIVVDMADMSLSGLSGVGYDMEQMLADADMGEFAYGDMSSVSINATNTKLAVALQANGYNDDGLVAIFDVNADGTLAENPVFVPCGKQPDALIFTPDGTKILVANEGEPREGYVGAVDPEGSVTIVDVETLTGTKVAFQDDMYDEYVLLKDGTTPAVDFEPEYIATNNEVAYVALQENNAIAVLDIAAGAFTGVYGLGLQDFNTVELDLIADGTIQMENQNVYGIRMPDGISMAEIDGTTYLFTANEGDGREWGSDENEYVNEQKGTTSPTGGVETAEKVTWFDPADYTNTLDQEKAYIFGSRSFSIFAVKADGLELVFDSGSDFEEVTAKYVSDYFNCSNDDISLEDRSGKKGVEPEYALVGEVDGSVYAFVGLERLGGIMVYDVTDPANSQYVNYINTREYSADIAGDVAPEGMAFIAAEQSPTGNALLLVANEVSGTMPVFELTKGELVAEETTFQMAFADVSTNNWFYDCVSYAVENGLFYGVSDTSFAPKTTMTREMFFMVLGRMADMEIDEATYDNGIIWDTTNEITREQLVTMLWSFAGEPTTDADLSAFVDVDVVSPYAEEAMAWAVDMGIVSGRTATELAPAGTALRAEIAAMLMNFLEQ